MNNMYINEILGEIFAESEKFNIENYIEENKEETVEEKIFEEPVITNLEGFDIVLEDEEVQAVELSEETLNLIDELNADALALRNSISEIL